MSRLLILDGPIGTELIARGFAPHPIMWTGLAAKSAPKLLKTLHMEYLRAGARMITANTFRTSPHTCAKAGLDLQQARDIVFNSVNIARDSIGEFDSWEEILLAGSMAPLEDCYQPRLVPDDTVLNRAHAEHASLLSDAGVDVILIETMNTIREARIASREAKQSGVTSVMASFVILPDGKRLLSGESLAEAASEVVEAGAEAVLINCVSPDVATLGLETLSTLRLGEIKIGAYANAAKMSFCNGEDGFQVNWESDTRPLDVRVKEYSNFARDWVLKYGARIIGSCCGTSIEYTRALSAPELKR